MMAYEQLVEAVEYAREEETNWWNYFDRKIDAIKVLKQASRYTPSDHEATWLASIIEDIQFDDVEFNASAIYARCIQELQKQLQSI